MNAHRRRTAEDRRRHRRRGPELALVRRFACELADERLARDTDHEWNADPCPQLRQRPQQRQVVLRPLAESDAGVGPHLRHPALRAASTRSASSPPTSATTSDKRDPFHHRSGRAAQMTEHDRRARLGRDPQDRRIQPPPGHVIHHRRPRRHRLPRRPRLVRVDRDAHLLGQPRPQPRDHRQHPRPLLLLGHHRCARPRRLTPDVDPVRPLPAIRTPASIAISAEANRPPSENESGVTFKTPTIRQRTG